MAGHHPQIWRARGEPPGLACHRWYLSGQRAAGPVTDGRGSHFVGEEQAVFDVAVAGNRLACCAAIQAVVDPVAAVATPGACRLRLKEPAVGSEERVQLSPAFRTGRDILHPSSGVVEDEP
jgi:hypothetical protein